MIRPEISHDVANAENSRGIWDVAWTQAQSDPHLLPSRVALYRVILEFIKEDGGLQSEIEEETLNKIRKLLINGASADIELFQTLIRENGYLLQENTQLFRMLHYIGCVVGVPEDVVQNNLKRITQWNIRSREMRDRMRKKQREHIEEAEEAELAQLMQEITGSDSSLNTTINAEHRVSPTKEAMIDRTFHDSDSDEEDLTFSLDVENDPLGLKDDPLEYKNEYSSNDSSPSRSPPVSRPLSRSSSPYTPHRESASSRNSSPSRESLNTSDDFESDSNSNSNINNIDNNSNNNNVNSSPEYNRSSTPTLRSGRVSPSRPLSRSGSPIPNPLTQNILNSSLVRSSSLGLDSNPVLSSPFKEDPIRRRLVRHDSLLKRSTSLAPLLGSTNLSNPLLTRSSDQPHTTNLFRFSHGSGHSSLQNSTPNSPTSKHVHFSDENNNNTTPPNPSPLTQTPINDENKR
eukprot:TRINITY_DN5668_c2_g1_i1.p1 TRINITY_DN5668_c2_g1~~TRINITY_DN5668_c2_g1_i1.p1  ORF type:complete len:471 (-),score=93.62 TRINITY_DN5668_c2_g1_i1:115-1494(-)